MFKSSILAAAVLLTAAAGTHAQKGDSKTVTITGWFSDASCAPARLTAAKLGPSNPDCSRQCIEKGIPAVFISESGREILKVKDYEGVKDDLGFHVEITGKLDSAAKTITVGSVKQLGWDGAACSRKPAGK